MAVRRVVASSSSTNDPRSSSSTSSGGDALSTSFISASSFLQASTKPTSNEFKLHLYALYKIATSSPRPSTSRPGIWEFTARAKWDAWSELGRNAMFEKGDEECRRNAMEAYIDEATTLGWKPQHRMELQEEEGVTISAEEAEPKPPTATTTAKRRAAGQGGMVSVSMMLQEEEDDDEDAPKSPLHELAIGGDHVMLEKYLTESREPKVNVDEVDAYGFAPIHLATDRGHTELVKILLRYGADKGLVDEDGNTPLQLAKLAGHEDIVELLRTSAP